jgi:hypothetical protein
VWIWVGVPDAETVSTIEMFNEAVDCATLHDDWTRQIRVYMKTKFNLKGTQTSYLINTWAYGC